MIEIRFGWKMITCAGEVESKVITIGHSAGGGTNYGQMDFISYIKEYHNDEGLCVFAKHIWGTGQWFRKLRKILWRRNEHRKIEKSRKLQ